MINLDLTNIDFDSVKTNLKNYLRGKKEFSDLDFEGSGLNYILDLLAYNTHLSEFYASMIGNEMFLDSAILRESVVSRAKVLGYLPKSRRAGQSTLIINFTELLTEEANSYPTYITIPAGTMFIGLGVDKTFTFTNRLATFAIKVLLNVFDGNQVVQKITYTNAPTTSIHYYYGGGVSDSSTSSCILINETYLENIPENGFKGNAIKIISGVGEGQSSLITAYDNVTHLVEFYPPFNVKPTDEGNDPSVIEILPTLLLDVHEGEPLKFSTIATGDPLFSFKIPNKNIDITSLKVVVTHSDSTTDIFTFAGDFVTLNERSKVFFIDEVEGGYHRINFGDGVIGVCPSDGDLVTVSYSVVSGDEANGIRFFRSTAASYILDSSGKRWKSAIECVVPCAGGSEIESIDSIKFSAPMNYSIQNRAITKIDYETIISNNFSAVDSVSVWGGESNDPPIYGTVFVSLKPKAGFYINENQKSSILRHLKKFSMPCIDHRIIDPDYIYPLIDSNVVYDPTKTIKSEEDLKTDIISAIEEYNDSALDNFQLALRHSKFTKLIDDIDLAIISNRTWIQLKKLIYPTLGVSESFKLNFNSAINVNVPILIRSSYFVMNDGAINYKCWFQNEPERTLEKFHDGEKIAINIYAEHPVTKNVSIYQLNVGYITPATGVVEINSFVPADFYTTDISHIALICVPVSYDVLPLRNQIITINSEDIKITMTPLI